MSAAKRPDPARVALRDQLGSAVRESYYLGAAFRLVNEADHSGFASIDVLTGPVRGIVDAFEQNATQPGFRWCKHLRPAAPAPAMWVPWHPERLYCVPCYTSLPPLSSKEDRRCDSCGTIQATITPGQITVPPAELPQREGKSAEARPPVTVAFGLCDRCMSAARAAQAESEQTNARPFRLPPAGRPVSFSEAEAFRLAVLIAQAQGDPEGTAGQAWQEVIRRAGSAGAGPAHVLWAACALITLIGSTLVAIADDPLPRSALWDSIGRDLKRVAEMSRAPAVRTENRVPESIELDCRRALALVRRFDAGDGTEAIASVPPDQVPELLAGAAALLRSLGPTVVIYGLAFPEAEVWSGILASVDEWEAQGHD